VRKHWPENGVDEKDPNNAHVAPPRTSSHSGRTISGRTLLPLMAQQARDPGNSGPKPAVAARPSLRANFMIDGNLVRLVADAAEIRAGDVVVEVGPGTGTSRRSFLRGAGGDRRRDLSRPLRRAPQPVRAQPAFWLIEGCAFRKTRAQRKRSPRRCERRAAAGGPQARKPISLTTWHTPLVIDLLLEGLDLLDSPSEGVAGPPPPGAARSQAVEGRSWANSHH